jgi:hypothetical protein
MSLIFTPAADIDTIPVFLNTLFYYFSLAPSHVTLLVEAADLRSGFPDKAVIANPVGQGHVSPDISLSIGIVFLRMS